MIEILPAPRVLVLGGSGMLGHKLAQVLGASGQLDVHVAARGELPAPIAQHVELHRMPDATSGAGPLAALLDAAAPAVIINAVGAIKQKDLHQHIDQTLQVNGLLPHLLARLAAERGARLIHFSTDCVFNGERGHYSEVDRPDAEDLYGRSKAVGEVDYGRHLTLRTSIIGFELSHHLGLLGWLLTQPRGSALNGFTNAIYSGLPTVTLARTVCDIVLRQPGLCGLYHVASEPIDKYTLLSMVNEALGLGHTLVPTPVPQIDRSLDDTRFRTKTNTQRPQWQQLVHDLVEDFNAGPYPRIYGFVYA